MDDDDHTADQSRCMELASPLLPILYEAWHTAFAKYHSYDPAFTAEHDDTTTANCIRSHMLTEVISRLDGQQGCKVLRLNRLALLNHRDELVWRFKKVDGNGRHRNVQTEQQQDFDDQLEIPGIPSAATRLTSGYQPDAAGLSIDRIVVSRPLGRSMIWASQINIADGAASWADITPVRFPGTARTDFRRRTGGRR
ncbi:MAG: hypothetical protein KF723_01225 [Rhizobiaceae bacterium]|nr:hypothetical protein [Rhizobiaceae bacterium]